MASAFFLLLLFFFWKDHVQQDGHQCGYHYRGTSKYRGDPFGEGSQGFGSLGNAHSKSNGQSDNGCVAEIHFLLEDQFDPGHGDGGENRDRSAAQYALRDGGQKTGKLRHKTGDHQDDGCQSKDAPVNDFCGGNDAYVLAVGGSRQSAKERTQDIADAVHNDAALQLFVIRHAVHTSGSGCRKISDGLNGVGKMQRLRKLEDSCGLYTGKIHQTKRNSQDISGHNSHQNGSQF